MAPPPANPKYKFTSTTVSVKNALYQNISRSVNYAIVDIDRVALVPIFKRRGWHVIKYYVDRAVKIHQNSTANPRPAFDQLKLITNGTFIYTKPTPPCARDCNRIAGHIVGYDRDDQDLKHKVAEPWVESETHLSRWYFAVKEDATGFHIEINQGNLFRPMTPTNLGGIWRSPTPAELKAEYKLMLHGGAMLFDATLDPNKPPPPSPPPPQPPTPPNQFFKQYYNDFNTNNDQYNGKNAYDGVNGAQLKARWGIGWLGGTEIVIVSAPHSATATGMTVHEFAQAVYALAGQHASGTPIAGIMFDGGTHHGFHACELDQHIGIAPANNAQQTEGANRSNHNHLAVFDVNNVALKEVAGVTVPRDYGLSNPMLALPIKSNTKEIEIKFRAEQSDYFKPTKNIKLMIARRALYVPGGSLLPQHKVEKIWPIGASSFGQDLGKKLSEQETKKLIAWSGMDALGLVWVISSLDKNDKTISQQEVPMQIHTGVNIAFLLDDSNNTATPALRSALLQTAMLAGLTALEKAKISNAQNPLIGQPTEVAVAGARITSQLYMAWSSNEAAFGDALRKLSHSLVLDFNDGFRHITTLFKNIGATKKRRVFFLVAGKHQSGRPFHEVPLQHLGRDGVVVHCIALGGTVDNNMLENKITKPTNGTVSYALTASGLIQKLNEIYAKDQNEEIILSIAINVPPGSTQTQKVILDKSGVATLQFYWDNAQTAEPELALIQPDGASITPANVGSFPHATFVREEGVAFFMITNPHQVTPGQTEWKIQLTGRAKRQQANQVDVLVIQSAGPEGQVLEGITVQAVDIPKSVLIGESVVVKITLAENSSQPELVRLFLFNDIFSAPEVFDLTEQEPGLWQVIITSDAIHSNHLSSYLFLENQYGSVHLPNNVPASFYRTEVVGESPAVIVDFSYVPDDGRENLALPVFIAFAPYSRVPDAVILQVRYQADPCFQSFPLQKISALLWATKIPASFIRAGIIESYFEVRAGSLVVHEPEQAPEFLFETHVASLQALSPPWLIEAEERLEDDFIKARLSLRRGDGAEQLNLGVFQLPGMQWCGGLNLFNKMSLTIDPSDYGVWVFQRLRGGAASRRALTKYSLSGKRLSAIAVSTDLRHCAIDPIREKIWGISADRRALHVIDLKHKSEFILNQNFYMFSVTVDVASGDVYLAGEGLYRLSGSGDLQLLNGTITNCQSLTLLPGGEMVCSAIVPQGYGSPRLLHLDANGVVVKQSTFETGWFVYQIHYDSISNRVWALTAIRVPNLVYCLNSNLDIEFAFSVVQLGVKSFGSIGLDHQTGQLWLTGEHYSGAGFLACISDVGEIEFVQTIRPLAYVALLDRWQPGLQAAHVPAIALAGVDATVSVAVTKDGPQPDSVAAFVRLAGGGDYLAVPLQSTSETRWDGMLPAAALRPGRAEIYFQASGMFARSALPIGAPQKTLSTLVVEQRPAWVGENLGFIHDQKRYAMRFLFVRPDGTLGRRVGPFVVLKDPQQYVYYAYSALVMDAKSATAWVFSKQSINNQAGNFLVRLSNDGALTEYPISQALTYTCIDPVRKVIWGASHEPGAKLIQLEVNSGLEKQIFPFEAWSLNVDAATGEAVCWGWGPGLMRGVYRFNENQPPVCMFKSEQPHRNITLLPNGEIICFSAFQEPGHHLSNRILRMAANGEVLFYSDAGVPHHSLYAMQVLCVDSVREEVWALHGTHDYRMNIICFDFELKRKFSVLPQTLSMSLFHSIALHPAHGGVWVFGKSVSGNNTIGLLVSDEVSTHRPYLFQEILPVGEYGGVLVSGDEVINR